MCDKLHSFKQKTNCAGGPFFVCLSDNWQVPEIIHATPPNTYFFARCLFCLWISTFLITVLLINLEFSVMVLSSDKISTWNLPKSQIFLTIKKTPSSFFWIFETETVRRNDTLLTSSKFCKDLSSRNVRDIVSTQTLSKIITKNIHDEKHFLKKKTFSKTWILHLGEVFLNDRGFLNVVLAVILRDTHFAIKWKSPLPIYFNCFNSDEV